MKSFLLFCITLTATLIISLFFSANDTYSQEISEGREFWFGLPYSKMKQPEPLLDSYDYPIYVFILSKRDTKVSLYEKGSGQTKTLNVKANSSVEFPLTDDFMAKESEEINDWGYYLKSDYPVTVYLFYAYRWNGEMMNIIPAEALGKEYYTLNMYQDSTDQMKPAQILVTATEDNTKLTYKPVYSTENCEANSEKSVILSKGQTFLILGKMDSTLTFNWNSDLTGTYLKADKRISVISGHTKGVYPKIQYVDSINRAISKNMLIEIMPPIEVYGTEYISVPIKYSDSYYRSSDLGDLIRFVALEDNTELYQLSPRTGFLQQLTYTLMKGNSFNLTNQDFASYYKSNKPILAGHYGKSNGSYNEIDTGYYKSKILTTKDNRSYYLKDVDDDILGHENILTSPGFLMDLIPIDRWSSYGSFYSIPNINNYLSLVFNYSSNENIKLDGEKILFIGSIQKLPGTDYAYFVWEVSPGPHFVEGINGAKFSCNFYGTPINMSNSFSYGSQCMYNFAKICNDTLILRDSTKCGNVFGNLIDGSLDSNSQCASIISQLCNESSIYNYTYIPDPSWSRGDSTFTFELKIKDPLDSAHATVEFLSGSGKTLTRTYTYYPEKVSVNPSYINFGIIEPNQKSCKNYTITNTGLVPVTINGLRIKNGTTEFEITAIDLPFMLQAGESKVLEVCAAISVPQQQPIRDTIIADLSCYPETVLALELSAGEPDIYITDADWGMIPLNMEKPKTVDITNRGTTNAEIYAIDWNDKMHFTHVEGLDISTTNPLVIKPGDTYTFTTYYKPNVAGIENRDSAYFRTNATKTKLYSIWQGTAADAGPLLTGYDWYKVRMIDEWQKNLPTPILEYKGQIELGCAGNDTLNVKGIIIENDPNGIFRLDMSQMPQKLAVGIPVFMNVYFAPAEEKEYTATVKLTAEFNNVEKYANATLHGIGIEPHINVVGHDFLPPILIGTSTNNENCQVQHRQNSDLTAMELTLISKLTIEGTDKDAFEIDPDWVSSHSFPLIVPIGTILEVPVRFKAIKDGLHSAQLIAHCDAPKEDNHIGNLTGYGYKLSISATNYDFPTIFIKTTNDNGMVNLINTGSGDVTITRDIDQSLFGSDIFSFNILDWYLSNDPLTSKPVAPITLKPGDSLNVRLSFTPMQEKFPYQAYIEYVTSIGTAYSFITGGGKMLRTIAEIPKYWTDKKIELKPGENLGIDFKFYKSNVEKGEIIDGNIKSFTARVYFNLEDSLINVLPDVKNCTDIIQSGTMTEGWSCDGANLLNNNTLEVRMSGTTPLSDSTSSGDVLFKFNMNTFISSVIGKSLALDCELMLEGKPYIIIDTIPGDVKIVQVCKNQMRLVELSSIQYTMSDPVPNPAGSIATIDYSIAFEGSTTFEIYDSYGNELSRVFNENLPSGSYRLTINIDALKISSGKYFVRMQSGAYSEIKKVVVVK